MVTSLFRFDNQPNIERQTVPPGKYSQNDLCVIGVLLHAHDQSNKAND